MTGYMKRGILLLGLLLAVAGVSGQTVKSLQEQIRKAEQEIRINTELLNKTRKDRQVNQSQLKLIQSAFSLKWTGTNMGVSYRPSHSNTPSPRLCPLRCIASSAIGITSKGKAHPMIESMRCAGVGYQVPAVKVGS